MRLSSIICFAAFALLASASPIVYSRRSNSLWRRIGTVPRGHVRAGSSDNREMNNGPSHLPLNLDHDHPDGTLIRDDSTPQRVSNVRLRDARSMTPYYPSTIWGPPTQPHGPNESPRYTFNEAHIGDLYLRVYRRPDGRVKLLYLSLSDGTWMTLYPTGSAPPRRPIELINYTTSEDRTGETYVEHCFGLHRQAVLSVKRDHNGQWTIMSGDTANIQWLNPHSEPSEVMGVTAQ